VGGLNKNDMKDSEAIYRGLAQTPWFKDVTNDRKVPIKRGCPAAQQGGCFCTGKCKEIIGFRDKLPNEY
jgi:hypothetical protein